MYLFIYLSIYLSVCLSVYLSICLSVYLFLYLSIYQSINLSICLSVYLSVYLTICLSVCLCVCLSIYLPISLSLYLFICLCLSVYLSIYRSFHAFVFHFYPIIFLSFVFPTFICSFGCSISSSCILILRYFYISAFWHLHVFNFYFFQTPIILNSEIPTFRRFYSIILTYIFCFFLRALSSLY